MATVYVDWGQHTVVVDPIRRDHWIHDGHDKHTLSRERGTAEAYKAISKGMGWHVADDDTPPAYLPTTREIDVMLKFPARACGNQAQVRHGLSTRCKGGVTEGDGLLPAITSLWYSGYLQDKSTGVIEHEMREAERFTGARLFDTTGYTR